MSQFPILTTTFTPAPECTDTISNMRNSPGPPDEYFLSLGAISTKQCFPDGWGPDVTFSPGICPQGYTIASQSIVSSSSTITEATCCPSKYYAHPTQLTGIFFHTSRHCFSKVTAATTLTLTTNGVTSTLALGPGDGINAWGVQIRWSAPSNGSSSQRSNPGAPGPSVGLIAGLSVLGFLFVAGIIGFLVFRRWARKFARQSEGGDHVPTATEENSIVMSVGHANLVHNALNQPSYMDPHSNAIQPISSELEAVLSSL